MDLGNNHPQTFKVYEQNYEISLMSAMNTMQKSQCISKYIRYQSPSIISSQVSPSFLKKTDIKDFLPAVGRYKRSFSPDKCRISKKINLLKNSFCGKERTHDTPGNELEVTGTCRVCVLVESKLSKAQEDLNSRRQNISLLEEERKERYYNNYKLKLKKISNFRDKLAKTKFKDPKSFRLRFQSTISPQAETSEISLQTPSNFNN